MKKTVFVWIVFFFLFSTSVMSLRTSAEDQTTAFQINLYKGWNLISIPVVNNFSAKTLAAQIPGCTLVNRWDVTEQTYKSYIVGGPPSFDFPIEDGIGYYVDVENDTVLNLTSSFISSDNVSLSEGYTLMGWYKASSTTASAIMDSILNCVNVTIFDPVNQVNKIYLSPADEDFTVSRGMGYWVEIRNGFQLNLRKGWNLVSIPIENNYYASTLAENITGCISISGWDTAGQTYETYVVGGPESFDFPIEDGIGYFINVESDTSILLQGNYITSDNGSLHEDLNLLGWYQNQPTTASSIMNAISNCVNVSIWDSVNQVNKIYLSPADEDFTVSKGMGYFVEINTPTEPEPNKNLEISAPSEITEGQEFEIFITCENNPVEQAIVTFNSVSYKTISDGKISVTAPSVMQDTPFTIYASKNEYIADQDTILIQNQNFSTISLKSPNGGELLSGTSDVTWSVSNPSLFPMSVTIQYRYYTDGWIKLVEDLDYSNYKYHWNTTLLPDGYPYDIKVILKEDGNYDGFYETLLDEDTSDDSFTIDNSISHLGWIYGTVSKLLNGSQVPLENARVHVIVSSKENNTIGKAVITDENGQYTIYIPMATYTIEVVKRGYNTETIGGINIWVNRGTEVNCVLQEGEQNKSSLFEVPFSENKSLLESAINNSKIGGEVNIKLNENQTDFESAIVIYSDVNIDPVTIKKGNLSFVIDGDNISGGKTIVITLDENFFNATQDIMVEYDGIQIKMADDIFDVLDPNDDGSNPEYLVTFGANGTRILVSIPHFSEHYIQIFSPEIIHEISEKVMRYKEIVIAASIIILCMATFFMFRKRDD